MSHKLHKKLLLVFIFLLGGISELVLAQQEAAIVYGSYSSRVHAEKQQLSLAQKVNNPVHIESADINGRTYYRLLGTADSDIEAKRLQLANIKGSFEPKAWLLIRDSGKTASSAAVRAGIKTLAGRHKSSIFSQLTPSRSAAENVSSTSKAKKERDLTVETGQGNTISQQSHDEDIPQSIILNVGSDKPLIIEKIKESDIDIKIDGRLDEGIWSQIKGVSDMRVINPDTLEQTSFDTIIKFVYTELGLYVGITNYQPKETLLARLTKRDSYINRDGNELVLDTSGQALYGLWFGVNLGGSIADGTILPEKNYSINWDGAWEGSAATFNEGYTTEYFLPWSMMAMPHADSIRNMGVLVSRRVAHLDETWSWPALPSTGSKYLSAMQPLELNDVNPKQQWAVFPYSSSGYDRIAFDSDSRVGTDVFWRPSPNLQITATLNPDFGTIESDDVVVNLTAFETYFREKRLFFVEGNEVFETSPRSNPYGNTPTTLGARGTLSSYTPSPTTLINTRRIGSAAITPDIPEGMTISDIELYQPTELYGAAKITGQSGRLRYGILSAFEEDTEFTGTDSAGNELVIEQQGRDFGALRLSYEDSSNGLKSIGWMTTAVTHPDRDAFVHSIDGHYISPSSNWRADIQLMHSDVADIKGYGTMADLSYRPHQGISHKLTFDYLDEDLNVNDFGFIRRNNVTGFSYTYQDIRSDIASLRNWTRSVTLSQETNDNGRAVRSGIFWRNSLLFQNRMLIRTELDYFPKRWDDRNSKGNGEFKIVDRWVGELGIGTDSSKVLSVSFAAGMLQEELGNWTKQVKGGITLKPSDRLSFKLDLIYQRRDGWLLHQTERDFVTYESTNWYPKLSLEYFISAHQQLRLSMQWAGIKADEQEFFIVPIGDGELIQVERAITEPSANFGISQLSTQLRYRWEIAPLSDLFIVYTRGSRLTTLGEEGFSDFFQDALTEPLVDVLSVKLRYRYGS